jgi:hypothetical protein
MKSLLLLAACKNKVGENLFLNVKKAFISLELALKTMNM